MEAPSWIDLPAPAAQLRVCVVIPAYDELETIEAVILSLDVEELTPEQVEILVCVNNTVDSPARAQQANRKTIDLLHRLQKEVPFALHILDRATEGRAFATDAGGVGHARRLLMDLATARLFEVGRFERGLIACLDGDSPADSGYLDDVSREMNRGSARSRPLAGVCRYRHPIPTEEEHARAIITYESWMRYFEAALQLVKTPYAFQSIGSCMVLTARGYAQADGVPPREALSDFYMLQKVVKTGSWGSVIRLRKPLVRPSARPSTRVPRGTGPSVRASMERAEGRFEWVEPPRAFLELRRFFAALEAGFEDPGALRQAASPFLAEIIERWNGWTAIDSLRENAPDSRRFQRQFHTCFDSLKIVKFANRSREKWGGVFLFDAIAELKDAGAFGGELSFSSPSHGQTPGLSERIELLQALRSCDHGP